MQFIEKNSFNVRSAIYKLKSDDTQLEFVLFPMIHIGAKEYYAEVSRRLAECSLILAEGIASKNVNLLTRSYRIVRKVKRLELITQREGINLFTLGDKVVQADMKGQMFDGRWTMFPLNLRAQLFFLAPVYAAYLFLFGTREMIAENIALDLPSSNEIMFTDDDLDKLDVLLIDERDRNLIRRIEDLHRTNSGSEKVIGVLYGAMHMRNVTRFLINKLNYKVASAEWVTVFDL